MPPAAGDPVEVALVGEDDGLAVGRDRGIAQPARAGLGGGGGCAEGEDAGESEDSCRHIGGILQRELVTGPIWGLSGGTWTSHHYGGQPQRPAGTRLRYHRSAHAAGSLESSSADRRRLSTQTMSARDAAVNVQPDRLPDTRRTQSSIVYYGGCNPCSIAVIRGFIVAGFRVHVFQVMPSREAAASSEGRLPGSVPFDESLLGTAEGLRRIVGVIAATHADAVVGQSDDFLLWMADNRAALPPACLLLCPPWEAWRAPSRSSTRSTRPDASGSRCCPLVLAARPGRCRADWRRPLPARHPPVHQEQRTAPVQDPSGRECR